MAGGGRDTSSPLLCTRTPRVSPKSCFASALRPGDTFPLLLSCILQLSHLPRVNCVLFSQRSFSKRFESLSTGWTSGCVAERNVSVSCLLAPSSSPCSRCLPRTRLALHLSSFFSVMRQVPLTCPGNPISSLIRKQLCFHLRSVPRERPLTGAPCGTTGHWPSCRSDETSAPEQGRWQPRGRTVLIIIKPRRSS